MDDDLSDPIRIRWRDLFWTLLRTNTDAPSPASSPRQHDPSHPTEHLLLLRCVLLLSDETLVEHRLELTEHRHGILRRDGLDSAGDGGRVDRGGIGGGRFAVGRAFEVVMYDWTRDEDV